MKNLTSLLIFILLMVDLMAQQQPQRDPQKVIASQEFTRLLVLPSEVEAQRQLFPEWQQGVVFLANGRYASDITFNYDIINNKLLVGIEQREYWLEPLAVDSIYLTNNQVLINPIGIEGADSDFLLLRIYDSRHLSLFRKTRAEVIEDDEDVNTIAYGSRPQQIEQQHQHLILHKAKNQISIVQGTRKELKKWEHGNELASWVKRENLNLQLESGLIRAVRYYERLTFSVD